MKYSLVKSSVSDIEKLIEYKKCTIYEYAKDLTDDDVNKITNYVNNIVPNSLDDYCNIIVDDKIVGCLFVHDKDDGVLLDEIYIEEEYRNNGIGTDIIKNILNKNDIVYLYVYKDNIRAISLYQSLGFVVIEDTDIRYYMKCSK